MAWDYDSLFKGKHKNKFTKKRKKKSKKGKK